jgi:hypothetical protein
LKSWYFFKSASLTDFLAAKNPISKCFLVNKGTGSGKSS